MRQNITITLLIIIVILISIHIYNLFKTEQNIEPFKLNYEKITTPDLYVSESKFLKNERGLYSGKPYKKGELEYLCPTIKFSASDYQKHGKHTPAHDHFFRGFDNYELISLGYGTLMNHNEEKQNMTWKVINNDLIKFYNIRDIEKDDELFVNYGSNYWRNRQNKK